MMGWFFMMPREGKFLIGQVKNAMSEKDIKEIKYSELKSFAESGLPKSVECCKSFDKTWPIQSHSRPFLLNQRNFIGIAATGSGKTLAFGVPVIMHVLQKRKNKASKRVNPLCLVLSPTRKLGQQLVKMVMFSVTWPLPFHQLAQEFMDPNPVKVVLGSEDLAANHDVMQIVEVLDDRSCDERLVSLLERNHKSQRSGSIQCLYCPGHTLSRNRVLVLFCTRRKQPVLKICCKEGVGIWKAVSIHGDKALHSRIEALPLFLRTEAVF